MERCYANFEDELAAMKPKLVFLLGKQVASFIYDKVGGGLVELSDDFHFSSFSYEGTTFVPVHHPSFILVYKRKFITEYTEGIQQYISKSKPKKNTRAIHSKLAFVK